MRREIIICVLIGAAAGMIGGLSGIGGGIFLVPLMIALMAMAQHQAHGTSLAVVLFIGLAGAIAYAIYGHVPGNMDWVLILGLALGSLVGVVLGARLMMRLPARHLRWIFGLFLVLVGIRMVTLGT